MKSFEIVGLVLCAAIVAASGGLLVKARQREKLKSVWKVFFTTPQYVRWLGKAAQHAAFTASLLLVLWAQHRSSTAIMLLAVIWLVLLLVISLRLSRKAAQLQTRPARPRLANEST